jgi:RHS repeat-associated protein
MSLSYNYVAAKSRGGGAGTGTANTGQLMDITGGQINGQVRNESYNYDQVARLTQAGGFYAQRNYTYDRFGNRTGVSGGASQSVTLQQPGGGVTNNRIASVNSGPSYQYDAAGDVTFNAAHSFSYDAESRIVKVDSGSTATYFYDSANRRVKKVVGSTTTYYVWEGAQVIAEYSNAAAGSGGTSYYLADRLSTRMITDSSGAFKGTQDHLPFGEEAGTSGTGEKHRFTSYERDSDSGSDYAMNRQHQYVNGRFAQPDQIGGSVSNPQSLNRYGYSLNDPVNLADPLGLDPYFWDASQHGPGVYLDGSQVMPEMWGMVFGLWAMGAADIDFPGRALLNSAPEWYIKEYGLQNPNDQLRDLPHGSLLMTFILGECGVNPVTRQKGFSASPRGTLGNLRPGVGGGGDFGDSRRNAQTGVRYSHQGLDISGSSGNSIVYAHDAGKVITVSNNANTRAGKLISVQGFDLNRTITTYMHTSENWVTVGQYVRRGQPLGLMGQTGDAGGLAAAEAHVHFQVTRNGTNIDPKRVLNDPCIETTLR